MITRYKSFIIKESIIKPEQYGIYKFEWEYGMLNCSQDVDLSYKGLTELPFVFGEIHGSFNCGHNKLRNMDGMPESVSKDFSCEHNSITHLHGSPSKVGGNFRCGHNEYSTLRGTPNKVGGQFNCEDDHYIDFVGCPTEIVGNFWCGGEYDGKPIKFNIEDYPLSIIHKGFYCGKHQPFYFNEINDLVRKNIQVFLPLIGDKEKFHQQIMELKPGLIPFYRTIKPLAN